MKKLFVTLSCVLFFAATVSSQITRQQVTTTNQVYATTGSILGTIYIKKTALPPGVHINQVVQAVQQGIRAFEFVPQSSGGFVPTHSLVDNKTKILYGATSVSLQSNTTTYAISYKISKLPIMKPMTVRLVGNAAKSLNFAVTPSLGSFPVAYLTTCDKVFECFNFSGSFIPVPK